MFNVVAYIARHNIAAARRLEDPQRLRDELLDAGFPEEDVERALSWLRKLQCQRIEDLRCMDLPRQGARCLTSQEADRVTAEARGLLVRLERGGLLSPSTCEAVYEWALTLDLPEVGPEELRVLISLLLWNAGPAGESLASTILGGNLESSYH